MNRFLQVRSRGLGIRHELQCSRPCGGACCSIIRPTDSKHRSKRNEMRSLTVEQARALLKATEGTKVWGRTRSRTRSRTHDWHAPSEYLGLKWQDTILEIAGVPRLRLYDLRHSAATLALAAGVSPKVVSEQLGHASTAFTLDTYAHVLPHMQDEAAARVEAMLFGATA
jgi:hypothetical protein